MSTIRLDKYLSEAGICSRRDAARAAKRGSIYVSGIQAGDSSMIISTDDEVLFCGERILYDPSPVFMMNKPAGFVCAAEDKHDRTVFELLGDRESRMRLFTVGRLDKDTTGLLLLTNDGALSHSLLSPKKHVSKTYLLTSDLPMSDSDISAFAKGVRIDRETVTLPAELVIDDSDPHKASLTICEGKFHQIKRMLFEVGKTVTSLKRVSFGGIGLDETLAAGEYRRLTKAEMLTLKSSHEA